MKSSYYINRAYEKKSFFTPASFEPGTSQSINRSTKTLILTQYKKVIVESFGETQESLNYYPSNSHNAFYQLLTIPNRGFRLDSISPTRCKA